MAQWEWVLSSSSRSQDKIRWKERGEEIEWVPNLLSQRFRILGENDGFPQRGEGRMDGAQAKSDSLVWLQKPTRRMI